MLSRNDIMSRPNRLIATWLLLFSLSALSCKEKILPDVEPEISTQGVADPVVNGGWRKMGQFLNKNCSPTYLFTLDNKAYFSLFASQKLASNFWQYDPAANTFTPKATLPGNEQTKLSTFRMKIAMAINGKGYAGIFWTDGNTYTETGKATLWEYDAASDNWTQKSELFQVGWDRPGVFTIGNKGYGCGWSTEDGQRNAESYSYDPASDQWTYLNSRISGHPQTTSTTAFALNNKGYAVNVSIFLDSIQTCEYDPITNQWNKFAGFPLPYDPKEMTSGVNYPNYTLGDHAYIYVSGTSEKTGITSNSIYQFAAATKQWTRMPDFGGASRILPVAFSIGKKAYIGFGYDRGVNYFDIWEYNP